MATSNYGGFAGGQASMKNQEDQKLEKILKLRLGSQQQVVKYLAAILEKSKNFVEFKNKMGAIDVAYARYKEKISAADTADGTDPLPTEGGVGCDVFADDDVTPPIVVSQVDSHVAYLAEVFLTGSPLFPVVSSPSKRKWAEQLEALLDDHAQLGGYVRQLLMFLRDGAKYNFSALEADWDSIDQFSVLADFTKEGTGQTIGRRPKKFTRLKRLNPRNVMWDYSMSPGDVSEHGDYAGYIDRMTFTQLKRHLNRLAKENKAYNIDKALTCAHTNSSGYTPNYTEDPQISDYITNRAGSMNAGVEWDNWFEPTGKGGKRGPPKGVVYERMRVYARIMPADFGITAPQPNTPQIWRFEVINNQVMVSAERIISAYDYLPILFGQPLEDGLGYQTQSVAEGEIPFQKAASTLFNIKFAASRRAVSDRALYIPSMIKPTDINSPVAAPKIPVNISQLSTKTLSDSYMQIPFDMRGLETTIQDAATIVGFSKDLHGQNSVRQGQFQKGNKSVAEFDGTMGASEARSRLPAMTLEHQVFSPLKSILSLNLFQYGEDAIVTSQVTGEELEIKIDELRKQVLSFRIADGYTPKSKLASTEIILAGMQMIGNSPILQQAYATRLPGMFAHFMSLSGLKGFEEYDPARTSTQQPAGLAANALQTPPVDGSQAPVQPIPANAAPAV